MAAEEHSFTIARRGYHPAEVDEHMERLETKLEMLICDRDAAVSQADLLSRQLDAARTEAERLTDQLGRLTAPPDNVENMGERMQWMLQLARDEAEEIRRKAAAEAAEVIGKSEEVHARNEAMRAEIESERSEIETMREQLLSAAHEEANRIRQEAAEKQARLDADSVARRTKIEEEFAAAMSVRRSELLATMAQTEASSRDEAQRRRAEAAEQARKLIAEATEVAQVKIANVELQLTQLRGMRRQVAEQLYGTNAALEQLLHRVQPLAEDEPVNQPVEPTTAKRPVPSPTPAKGTEAKLAESTTAESTVHDTDELKAQPRPQPVPRSMAAAARTS